jgi:hypothetical protein
MGQYLEDPEATPVLNEKASQSRTPQTRFTPADLHPHVGMIGKGMLAIIRLAAGTVHDTYGNSFIKHFTTIYNIMMTNYCLVTMHEEGFATTMSAPPALGIGDNEVRRRNDPPNCTSGPTMRLTERRLEIAQRQPTIEDILEEFRFDGYIYNVINVLERNTMNIKSNHTFSGYATSILNIFNSEISPGTSLWLILKKVPGSVILGNDNRKFVLNPNAHGNAGEPIQPKPDRKYFQFVPYASRNGAKFVPPCELLYEDDDGLLQQGKAILVGKARGSASMSSVPLWDSLTNVKSHLMNGNMEMTVPIRL